MHNYRDFILRELERRQRKNPSYSLRAFARDLEIPSSRLSEILNRKMGLSESRAVDLANKLSLSSTEREFFIDLALSEHARSAIMKEMAQRRVQARAEIYSKVSDQEFSILREWYHLAIMEYLALPTSNHTAQGISQSLGLEEPVVEKALENLVSVGFLEKGEGDQWQTTAQRREGQYARDSQSVHTFYSQLLDKVRGKLEKPDGKWEVSASIMQFKREDYTKAVERIKNFRRELISEMEAPEDKDSVYCLAVQLFELTNTDS